MRSILLLGHLVALAYHVIAVAPGGKGSGQDVRAHGHDEAVIRSFSPVDTTQRLSDLREQMASAGFDAYIVPTPDAHLSEYIAPSDRRREWMTGFTGSAGTAVVTLTSAALWTDGRYFEQAENQLDQNWVLMREGQYEVPTIEEWLTSQLEEGSTVGANPFLFAISEWQSYAGNLSPAKMTMSESDPDLVDLIWTDRPTESEEKIFVYPEEYAGKSYREKLQQLRGEMENRNCTHKLMTRLDDIAWFVNLRGGDIPFTPVFKSYLIVSASDHPVLFLNSSKLEPDVLSALNAEGCTGDMSCVDVRDYDQAQVALSLLGESVGNVVWMASDSTSYGMFSKVPVDQQLATDSTIPLAKGVKNAAEERNMLRGHVIDAVALCGYLMWLEQQLPLGGVVDELSGSERLAAFRAEQELSRGPSFGSISASGPNAAIIHYEPTEDTKRMLTTDEMYMIDSGGQYFEGTTDVTRSLHFGTPKPFEKEMFTRALMGLIDAERSQFPAGTIGDDIDLLIRRHIWDAGYDFNHGTGHGIGQYLCVHEYPPGIGVGGSYSKYSKTALQPGMFVSLEPGYYESGSFGLRHENIVHVIDTGESYEGRKFYQLEAATLVPFQRKMIETSMMSQQQIDYLNSYHARVLDEVGGEMTRQGKHQLREWLVQATRPVQPHNSSSSSSTTTRQTKLVNICLFALLTLANLLLLHF